MAQDDGPQWVKVEFYGRVPDGQVIADIDRSEISGALMRAFGFTHIDGLTVAVADYGADLLARLGPDPEWLEQDRQKQIAARAIGGEHKALAMLNEVMVRDYVRRSAPLPDPPADGVYRFRLGVRFGVRRRVAPQVPCLAA